MEDFKLIPLTQGRFAIVDPEDCDQLSRFKWHCSKGYARRVECLNGTKRLVLMHRVIINAPDHTQVDHINGNRLDNRKSNLRLCTATENAYNRRRNKEGRTSKYKGVHWCSSGSAWRATLGDRYLGLFKSEEDAAVYYDAAARFYYGEFASTNFPGKDAMSAEEILKVARKKERSQYSSVFEGVSWRKTDNKWVAYCCPQSKIIRIGLFNTEEEAAIARDQKVKELGIKTRLNFPD